MVRHSADRLGFLSSPRTPTFIHLKLSASFHLQSLVDSWPHSWKGGNDSGDNGKHFLRTYYFLCRSLFRANLRNSCLRWWFGSFSSHRLGKQEAGCLTNLPQVTQLVSGEAGFELGPRDPEHVLPSAAGHCLAGALRPVSLTPPPYSEEQGSRRAFINL